jgi:hypothetical protein
VETIKPRGEVKPIEQLTQLNSNGEVVITVNDLNRAVSQADPALKRFLQARSE